MEESQAVGKVHRSSENNGVHTHAGHRNPEIQNAKVKSGILEFPTFTGRY